MKKDLRALCVLFASLLPAALAAAQPTVESIEELLVVSEVPQALDMTHREVEKQFRAILARMATRSDATPELKKAMEALSPQLAAMIRNELNVEQLKPLFVQGYKRLYTQEEVDGTIAFYRSPAGQAYLHKGPQLKAQVSEAVFARTDALTERLVASLRREEALARAEASLQPPATAASGAR